MLSERRLSYNALGPVPGFNILYLRDSFNSLVLTESTGFADRKRIGSKPKVTEVLSPKAESQSSMFQKLYSQAALCNGVQNSPGELLS